MHQNMLWTEDYVCPSCKSTAVYLPLELTGMTTNR